MRIVLLYTSSILLILFTSFICLDWKKSSKVNDYLNAHLLEQLAINISKHVYVRKNDTIHKYQYIAFKLSDQHPLIIQVDSNILLIRFQYGKIAPISNLNYDHTLFAWELHNLSYKTIKGWKQLHPNFNTDHHFLIPVTATGRSFLNLEQQLYNNILPPDFRVDENGIQTKIIQNWN